MRASEGVRARGAVRARGIARGGAGASGGAGATGDTRGAGARGRAGARGVAKGGAGARGAEEAAACSSAAGGKGEWRLSDASGPERIKKNNYASTFSHDESISYVLLSVHRSVRDTFAFLPHGPTERWTDRPFYTI